jgi:sialic acid synthase SpsE
MSKVFIIAEAALTWLHGGLDAAYRSIHAAKECGASAWKTQWTSDHEAMEMRRGVPRDQYKRLQWAGDCLPKLKEECDRVGIEFMCTVFIPQDIPTISQYVKRFKVSAFESRNKDFVEAHIPYNLFDSGKEVIVSYNPDNRDYFWLDLNERQVSRRLHCISKYPTPIEDLKLLRISVEEVKMDGLSDHTTSVLTGAVAVGAGARILEHHFRLDDTPESDPDYPHSFAPKDLATYISNVREAERML